MWGLSRWRVRSCWLLYPTILANGPKGEGLPDYGGVTGMEYALIGLILAYGVYDSSLRKC